MWIQRNKRQCETSNDSTRTNVLEPIIGWKGYMVEER